MSSPRSSVSTRPVPAPEVPTTWRTTVSSDRWAARTFAVLVMASFVALVFWFGRDRWFFGDEWSFLAGPDRSTFADLFHDYNGHWVALPRIAYRLLWALVGIRAYWPYLAVLVALHLVVVTLLRLIMRRAGVGAWMATLVASTFLLFGSGEENILWAFQISFVGALAFGLGHLVLAGHDGAYDRRDAWGLACGLGGLMCSGLAPTMVMIVGLATVLRRGWKPALFHTVPLGVAFLVWVRLADPFMAGTEGPTLDVGIWWVRISVVAAFMGFGQYAVIAIALGCVMVVGLTLAWARMDLSTFRRRGAAPAALMIGVLGFYASVAHERWTWGEPWALSGRYTYTGVAMVLPALGVAVDAVVRRWRWAIPAILVVLLVGVPGNINTFAASPFNAEFFATRRDIIVETANSPLAGSVPREVVPDPDVFGTKPATVGWALDARRDGKLPEPGAAPKALKNQIPIRLGFSQTKFLLPSRCETYDKPQVLEPAQGSSYGITKPVAISQWNGSKRTSTPLKFDPANGNTLVVNLPDLVVHVAPVAPNKSFQLCQ